MKQIASTIILGVLNIALLICGGIAFGNIQQEELNFKDVPVLSWNGETGEYNYVDDSFADAKYWFRVDTGSLERGIYRLHISYVTDSSANSVGINAEPDSYHAVVADNLFLDADYKEFEQEIWINRVQENINISIDRENTGYMQINSITLTRCNTRSFTYLMLKLIIKLLVVDIVYILFKFREKIKQNYFTILGLLSIFIISSFGNYLNCMIEGHDIWFHLTRIEGIKDGLLSGAFPVKIQPNWLNGYGFAVSTMYGELLLYIPGILRVLGMPLQYCYQFYQVLISLGTVLISYFVFRKISKDRSIGLLACAIYSLSNYLIGSIWIRSGVGEYSAMMFLPLVVLGMWELLIAEHASENAATGWIWLALGYCGLIQTHILSCEIVTFFVAFVCILKIKQVFTKQTFIALCKAVISVILVNLWFLVPFLDYMREDFKLFSEKGIEYIQRVGITWYQMLSLTTGGRGTDQRYNASLSGAVPTALGLSAIIILLLSSVMIIKMEWKKQLEKRIVAVCMGIAIMACFMSTNLFPWDAIMDSNSIVGSLVVSIRRPTRLMTIAVITIALLTCLVFIKLKEKLTTVQFKILILLLMCCCAVEALLFTDIIMRGNSTIVRYDGENMNWQLAVSGQEYFYSGTDCTVALIDTEVQADVNVMAVERDYNQFVIQYQAEKGGYIECPISYYRGYRAEDELSGEYFEVMRGENNKLKIVVPTGYEGKLYVYFKEPWYWRMAELISLLAILGFMAVLICLYFRKRKRCKHV